jgi:hypothetical protein
VKCFRPILLLLLFALAALPGWWLLRTKEQHPAEGISRPTISQPEPKIPTSPTAAEALLEGYGDPANPPIEDLRKVHRVTMGYFSIVKDPGRFPIGGNADLAAALRGENANREVFVREGNAVFTKEGLLKDRWGNPLIVHPEGWRQLELRSAGPDGIGYNEDDVVLSPSGVQTTK